MLVAELADDRALAGGEEAEQRTLTRAVGHRAGARHVPERVPVGRLDHRHIGAGVRVQLRGVGTTHAPSEIHHAHAGERCDRHCCPLECFTTLGTLGARTRDDPAETGGVVTVASRDYLFLRAP